MSASASDEEPTVVDKAADLLRELHKCHFTLSQVVDEMESRPFSSRLRRAFENETHRSQQVIARLTRLIRSQSTRQRQLLLQMESAASSASAVEDRSSTLPKKAVRIDESELISPIFVSVFSDLCAMIQVIWEQGIDLIQPESGEVIIRPMAAEPRTTSPTVLHSTATVRRPPRTASPSQPPIEKPSWKCKPPPMAKPKSMAKSSPKLSPTISERKRRPPPRRPAPPRPRAMSLVDTGRIPAVAKASRRKVSPTIRSPPKSSTPKPTAVSSFPIAEKRKIARRRVVHTDSPVFTNSSFSFHGPESASPPMPPLSISDASTTFRGDVSDELSVRLHRSDRRTHRTEDACTIRTSAIERVPVTGMLMEQTLMDTDSVDSGGAVPLRLRGGLQLTPLSRRHRLRSATESVSSASILRANIVRINEELQALQQLTTDLAVLVETQAEEVEHIEESVECTLSSVRTGKAQLLKASVKAQWQYAAIGGLTAMAIGGPALALAYGVKSAVGGTLALSVAGTMTGSAYAKVSNESVARVAVVGSSEEKGEEKEGTEETEEMGSALELSEVSSEVMVDDAILTDISSILR